MKKKIKPEFLLLSKLFFFFFLGGGGGGGGEAGEFGGEASPLQPPVDETLPT